MAKTRRRTSFRKTKRWNPSQALPAGMTIYKDGSDGRWHLDQWYRGSDVTLGIYDSKDEAKRAAHSGRKGRTNPKRSGSYYRAKKAIRGMSRASRSRMISGVLGSMNPKHRGHLSRRRRIEAWDFDKHGEVVKFSHKQVKKAKRYLHKMHGKIGGQFGYSHEGDYVNTARFYGMKNPRRGSARGGRRFTKHRTGRKWEKAVASSLPHWANPRRGRGRGHRGGMKSAPSVRDWQGFKRIRGLMKGNPKRDHLGSVGVKRGRRIDYGVKYVLVSKGGAAVYDIDSPKRMIRFTGKGAEAKACEWARVRS